MGKSTTKDVSRQSTFKINSLKKKIKQFRVHTVLLIKPVYNSVEMNIPIIRIFEYSYTNNGIHIHIQSDLKYE